MRSSGTSNGAKKWGGDEGRLADPSSRRSRELVGLVGTERFGVKVKAPATEIHPLSLRCSLLVIERFFSPLLLQPLDDDLGSPICSPGMAEVSP